jgi:hypothetical protein
MAWLLLDRSSSRLTTYNSIGGCKTQTAAVTTLSGREKRRKAVSYVDTPNLTKQFHFVPETWTCHPAGLMHDRGTHSTGTGDIDHQTRTGAATSTTCTVSCTCAVRKPAWP